MPVTWRSYKNSIVQLISWAPLVASSLTKQQAVHVMDVCSSSRGGGADDNERQEVHVQ